MIKLIKTQSTDPRIENTQGPKRKVPLIPILKDLHHIELLSSIHIKVLNPDEPHEFELTITPEEKSVWYGGSYVFDFLIPENYPMEPPKYKCKTKIFHPNIDHNGNLCIKIQWNPKMSAFHLNYIFMSIMNLFAVRVLENINCKEPDCTDPLNMDAAALLSKGKDEFRAYMIEHGLL